MTAPYRIDIWYAKNVREGDKYYKILTFVNADRKLSIALSNYGPCATHVSLVNVTTGQSAVLTDVVRGTQAGDEKRGEKRNGGYTGDIKNEKLEFQSYSKLTEWVRTNVATKRRAELLQKMNAHDEFKLVAPAPVPPPHDPGPDLMKKHDLYGTW